MGNLRKEHNYQTLAFEEFYALRSKGVGVDAIFKILAEKYNKGRATIESWYVAFKWPERANNRDVTVRQRVAENVEDTLETVIVQQRQIIKATLSKYVQALRDNKVKVDADTMRRLLEHQLILHGHNPFRPQVQIFQNTNIQNVLTKLGVLTESGKKDILSILEDEFSGMGGNSKDQPAEPPKLPPEADK